MALVHEDQAFTGDSTAAGSCPIDMPSTVPDDDVILLLFGGDGTGAFSDLNGFTATTVNAAVANNGYVLGAYRVASSLAASYTLTRSEGTEAWVAAAVRFSGADTTDPIGAISTVTESTVVGTGGNAVAPAVVAEDANSKIVRVWYLQGMSSARWSGISAPTGSIGSVDSAGASPGATAVEGLYVAVEDSPGASTSTGTANLPYESTDSTPYAAWTIEVLPAAAGGSSILPLINAYYG